MSPYIVPGLAKIEPIKPAYLLQLVCNFFGIPIKVVTSKSRKRIHTNPRFVAMYLLRMDLKLTYEDIGDLFYRDHTSVLYAVGKVKGFMQVDEKYLVVVTRVSNYIQLHQGRMNYFRITDGLKT